MEKKNNKGFIFIIIILIGIILGLVGYIVYNNSKSDDLVQDNTTTTQKEISTTSVVALEVKKEDYVGSWYKDKDNFDSLKEGLNPVSLDLKLEKDTLIMNLYFTRVGNFEDIIIKLENNKASFEGVSENARSNDGTTAKIKGEITLDSGMIILTILETNVSGIDKEYEFLFRDLLSIVDENYDNLSKEEIAKKVLNNYFVSLYSKGEIDDFSFDLTLVNEDNMCPGEVYDKNKIYASIVVSYKTDRADIVITGNDNNLGNGEFKASATYIIENVNDTYKINTLYTGC